MEQPEVFTPEQYRGIMHSMQPVYGQTKGLGNKTITVQCSRHWNSGRWSGSTCRRNFAARYELAEYNYAIEHIHFPADRKELLFARKRLVFDEFLFFLLSVRQVKGKTSGLKKQLCDPAVSAGRSTPGFSAL